MKTKIKARLMKNGVASFISLVDNPANRIPFRVTKREKSPETPEELSMFNSIGGRKTVVAKSAAPALLAYICRKSEQAQAVSMLTELKLASDDCVEQDGMLIFKQAEYDDAITDVTPIQLDKGQAVLVSNVQKNFSPFTDSPLFADNIAANGFFPGLNMAFDAMYEAVWNSLFMGDDAATARANVTRAAQDFAMYVSDMVNMLPEVVFKISEPEDNRMLTVMKHIVEQPLRVEKLITQNDPRPANGSNRSDLTADPAAGAVDSSVTATQQAAGEAAAAAAGTPEETDKAYNDAVSAAVTPDVDENDNASPVQGEVDPATGASDPEALVPDSGNDPAVHDGNTAMTNDDEPHLDPALVAANASRDNTSDDRYLNAEGDGPGDIREVTANVQASEKAQQARATAGTKQTGGDSSTVSKVDSESDRDQKLAAVIKSTFGELLAPVVKKVDDLAAQVNDVEVVAKAAKDSSETLGNTVLGTADAESDELNMSGLPIAKSEKKSLWDGIL